MKATMELPFLQNQADFVVFVLGLSGGVGFTWVCLHLLYRLRLRAATKKAASLALDRSRCVLKGQASEQLAPLTGGFPYLANDARFLGSPIDYLVFDGLSDSDELEIVFVEVKSGGSKLSARERRVRDAIRAGRVRWTELRMP